MGAPLWQWKLASNVGRSRVMPSQSIARVAGYHGEPNTYFDIDVNANISDLVLVRHRYRCSCEFF